MDTEKSLQAACKFAKSTIDDTYAFCERNFPPDDFPRISTALQGLLSCINNENNLIGYITQSYYAETFTSLCSTESGRHAVQELITALTGATEFIIRRYPPDDEVNGRMMEIDLSLVAASKPSLQEELKRIRDIIKYHESAIKDCSNKVSTMFASSASFAAMALVKQNTQRDDDYKATLSRLISVFQQNPFAVKRSWDLKSIDRMFPLSVLNHHHYTSLATGDLIQQPSFHGTEQVGIAWVDQQRENGESTMPEEGRRHIHAVARAFLITVKETTVDAKSVQLGDQRWVHSFAATQDCLRDITQYLDNLKDVESEPRRYAVCGRMSAGKSSVINSMIGAKLLPESSLPCTGWPTVIKDDPNRKDPALTVNPAHFQPFIEFLRDWYQWFRLEERESAGEEKHDKSVVMYSRLTTDLQNRLAEFQNPQFKIRELSVSQDEITKTTQDISDIIRLSYALAPTRKRPDPGNQDFPVLTCNFKDIGRRLRGTEFVDLPGLGDANVDDMEIEEIYRIAMQSCHGTIMVIDTSKNTIISDRSVVSAIKRVNQVTKDKPLAVICTGSDQHDNRGETTTHCWKEDKKMELRRMIYESSESSECRFLFCSPPLYRSAQYLMERIEETKKGGTRLDYDDAWQHGGELCMETDFSGRYGRKNWNGCDYDELKETFESAIQRSRVTEIPGLLYRTLEVEVLDKRYLDIMNGVRKYLKLLWKKQQVMLEHSNSNRQAMEAAKKRCSDFRQDSYGLMTRWEIKGQEFLRQSMEELEEILTSAERKAADRLEQAVKSVAIGVKYRSTNPSAFEIADVTMLLADQAEAVRFLFDVDNEVRAQLDKLQDEIVTSVRNTAKVAWEGRIRALGKFFEDHKLDMPDIGALRDKLVSKLQKKSQEDIATALAELVESQIGGQKQPNMFQKMLKNVPNPFKARSDASQQALDWSTGKSTSENDEAIAAKLTRVLHLQKPNKALSADEAEDLHTKGVNYLGYLIRAPVSGNVAECPINTKIWTFLKDSKKSIKPVEVKLNTVLDKYRELVVRGWAEIVQNDSRTSLRGAILLSGGIAKKIVLEALDNHRITLDEAEKAMARPMDTADEENLILMQMDFTAAFAASDCIHQLLTAEHDKVSKTVL